MIQENEYFKIKINIEKTYTLNSSDNKFYNTILNPFNYTRNDYPIAMEIVICDEYLEEKRIALIGRLYGYDDNCAVLDNKELVVLIDKDIFIIDLVKLKIIRYKKIECCGVNFSIHQVKDGYIVYGELEVFKLGYDFNILWNYSGSDIFVNIDDKNPFMIDEGIIKIYDWNGKYCEIDFDGKILNRDSD